MVQTTGRFSPERAPDGDRGSHTYGCVHGAELEAQGVTPYVAWEYAIAKDPAHRIKRRAVHAPGAEDRRPGRNSRNGVDGREGRRRGHAGRGKGIDDRCRGEFSLVGDRAVHLAVDVCLRRHPPDDLLYDGVELLDDEDPAVLVDKLAEPVLIDRVGADDRK